MGREKLEKVRNQVLKNIGFEKVWNWLTKSGRVGKWVKKSGKCREFHVFEGVENITQFIKTRQNQIVRKPCPLVSNILKYSL